MAAEMPKINFFIAVRRWLLVALTAALLASVSHAAFAQVVVVVNGAPITAFDIEQRAKLIQISTRKTANRQEVINELINDQLKIFIAKRYGIEASDTEVDNTFGEMSKRNRQTPDQFAQVLSNSGVSPGAFKARLRADIVWGQLIRGKFGSTLQVGESDIAKELQGSSGDGKEAVGFIYTLYPILFVLPSGSTEGTVEAKRREAENLRGRIHDCKEGIAFARALRDVAVREPVVRSSADLAPQLRELLDKMEIGQLTTPEATPQGLQMFALCEKKQSNAEAPNKREMRDKIFARRFESEAKKFLEEVRRSAMIEYR